MSYYQIIGLIFQSFIIIIPTYLLLFKRNSLLESSVTALLCLGATINYDYRLFNSISLMQILLVIITFSSYKKFNHLRQFWDRDYKLIRKNVIIFIGYISIITIIGYLSKYEYKLIGGVIQNELRPFVQIIQFLFIYLSFLACLNLNCNNSLNIITKFHKALILFAIAGICQSLIYYFTSFDIFPMRKDFVSSINGLSAISDNGFLRATAGLGEPKQFAKIMSIGFAINLLSYKLLGYNNIKLINLFIFLIAIFFSSSTTGYFISLVVVIIYLFKRIKKDIIYIIPVLLVFFLFKPVFLNMDVVANKITYAYNNGEIPGFENSDTATFLWLLNEPQYILTGTGIANTVAYANQYAPPSSLYINNYPYTLRRGIIKLLAEGGLIALLLQTNIFKKLYKYGKSNNNIKYLILFIIIMYMVLTCEAVIEIQMILLALLYNISRPKIQVIWGK